MQLARIVRTVGLIVVLGLAGSGGGCGLGSPAPLDPETQNQIKGSKKAAHRQIMEDAQKAPGGANQQGALRKGARRGAPGR